MFKTTFPCIFQSIFLLKYVTGRLKLSIVVFMVYTKSMIFILYIFYVIEFRSTRDNLLVSKQMLKLSIVLN